MRNVLILHPDPKIHECFASQGYRLLFSPQRFETLTATFRASFADLVAEVGNYFGNSEYIWSSALVSRNTLISHSYLNCMYAIYAIEMAQTIPIHTVVTESRALYQILRKRLSSQTQIICISKQTSIKCIKSFIRHCYTAFDLANRWISTRYSKQVKIPLKKINMIDVFVNKESLVNGNFQDRYYKDFVHNTVELNWKYLSTFYGIRNYFNAIKVLKKNQIPFIIKEEYLKISDFFTSWLFPIKIYPFSWRNFYFEGLEVGSILKEDLLNNSFQQSSVEAVLNFKFVKRFVDEGNQVDTVIDWFEGQNIDKALELGFHTFSPKTLRVGYQGFVVGENYLCQRVTQQEASIGVAPHLLAVIGNPQEAISRKINPHQAVIQAPAFRFHTARDKNVKKQRHTVFFPLPIGQTETKRIISVALEFEKFYGHHFKIIIKPHPAMPTSISKQLANSKIELTAESFQKLSEDVVLIISNTSSILVEAIASHIPVIVLGSETELTQNPIPELVSPRFWSLAFGFDEIRSNIERLLSIPDLDWETDTSLQKIFNPATKEDSRLFARKIQEILHNDTYC